MRQSLCHQNESLLTRFPFRYEIASDSPMSILLRKRNPAAFDNRDDFTKPLLLWFQLAAIRYSRSAAKSARIACASPPSGRPACDCSFQANRSRCNQGISSVIKRCKNNAATTAPAKGLAEILLMSATG